MNAAASSGVSVPTRAVPLRSTVDLARVGSSAPLRQVIVVPVAEVDGVVPSLPFPDDHVVGGAGRGALTIVEPVAPSVARQAIVSLAALDFVRLITSQEEVIA